MLVSNRMINFEIFYVLFINNQTSNRTFCRKHLTILNQAKRRNQNSFVRYIQAQTHFETLQTKNNKNNKLVS